MDLELGFTYSYSSYSRLILANKSIVLDYRLGFW